MRKLLRWIWFLAIMNTVMGAVYGGVLSLAGFSFRTVYFYVFMGLFIINSLICYFHGYLKSGVRAIIGREPEKLVCVDCGAGEAWGCENQGHKLISKDDFKRLKRKMKG